MKRTPKQPLMCPLHGSACGAPLTLGTLLAQWADGEGQARGQARNARGEPLATPLQIVDCPSI